MDPRDELDQLRKAKRLRELEAKAGSQLPSPPQNPNQIASNIEQKTELQQAQDADMNRQAAIGEKTSKGFEQGLPVALGVGAMAQGGAMLGPPAIRGIGHLLEGGAKIGNAALHPVGFGDAFVKGTRSLAELLKGVGKGVGAEAPPEAAVEAPGALESVLGSAAKASNKLKNKNWDFPVRKNYSGE